MRVLLFDIDGTLLRASAERGYRKEVRRAVEAVFGTAGRLDEVNFGGKTDVAILREALEPVGIGIDVIWERLGDWEVSFHELTTRLVAEGPLFERCPGVGELLQTLDGDDRYVLSLLTGNLERMATAKLASVGLDHHFRVRGAYGSDKEHRNHLPAVAAERISAAFERSFAPTDFVVIGDTPLDIAAARHFGMRCVAVATGGYDMDALAAHGPDALLPDLADPEAVLAAIDGDIIAATG